MVPMMTDFIFDYLLWAELQRTTDKEAENGSSSNVSTKQKGDPLNCCST